MPEAFRDRPPTAAEFEGLRLLLSTFRDGGGQQVLSSGTMPGFRDFERSLAAVLYAYAPENKGVFDVHVPASPKPFGISCKMTRVQPPANRSSFMELSNSAKKFNDELDRLGIDWAADPTAAGAAVVNLVTSWHYAEADEIDIEASSYVVLAHDARWKLFQLLWFPLNLAIADPVHDVEWALERASLNGYVELPAGRYHRLWQWFRNSGGQLKYYPPLDWALWTSELFELEQPPVVSVRSRAIEYFLKLWPRTLPEAPEEPETATA